MRLVLLVDEVINSVFTIRYGSCISAIKRDSRTIIAYDRRCAGASEYTIGQYFSLETIALDTLELVHGLGHRKATVVGTSMGGPVALWLAINKPDFCERLVILNSHPALVAGGLPFSLNAERMERARRLLAMDTKEQRAEFDSRKLAEKMRGQELVDIDAGGKALEDIRAKMRELSDDELFIYWAGNNHNLLVKKNNVVYLHYTDSCSSVRPTWM